jgi:hypothetical protein
LDGIGESQKKQIRESFKTCIETEEYELNNWNLCIPIVMDIEQTKWWFGWKTKMEKKYNKKIFLYDGSRLLGLLKEYNLFNEIFDVTDTQMIEAIYEELVKKKRYLEEVIYEPEDIDYEDHTFIGKLESANINEHSMCQKEFYNAEIMESAINSKEVEVEKKVFENLRNKVHSVWFTKYIAYSDENDGNALLSSVYERIEDLDSELLGASNEISIFVKKGMLHQLADKCEVGWVKNYKAKYLEYIKRKIGEKNE